MSLAINEYYPPQVTGAASIHDTQLEALIVRTINASLWFQMKAVFFGDKRYLRSDRYLVIGYYYQDRFIARKLLKFIKPEENK